jgi:hypothetical protein
MALPPSGIGKPLSPFESPFLSPDEQEQPIEITIGDESAPEEGSIEIEMDKEPGFNANLADYVDESVLTSLSSELLADFDNDKQARKEWEKTYVDGLDLLGLKIEERSEPWDGACGVFHPMLSEAAIRFQSEMISETFPAQGPVKARIIGKQPREIEEAAQRVVDDMNYQLTVAMPEFRPEHERMLWSLSLAGSAFKKVYFDPALNRQTSMFVPAEDLVVPYGASDIMSAPRATHIMRKTKNDIKKLQYAGFYRDIDLGEPTKLVDDVQKRKDESEGYSGIYDNRYQILEMLVDYDLPGFEDVGDDGEPTGIALPYVISIDRGTGEVLAIRRNWKEEDPFFKPRQHFVHYCYIPGFGFYGFGLIHLIGGFAKSGTSILRQLIDAGTLSNLPGGLKSRGLRIKGDDTPIMPGEWRDVDVPGTSIRDNILPLPYKEPSATLFQLMQNVVEEARRLAAVADVDFGSQNSEAPVGTTLAILERTLKVMSAVQARVHTSMAQEFKLIAELIRDFTAPEYEYQPEGNAPPAAKKDDYAKTDIIPVSDPNASTMAQRIIQYQAAIQMSQQNPQIYNLPLLHRSMLEVMGIKNADKIVPVEDDVVPMDPVTENMRLLTNAPVKAFLNQDHEAHIAVHQTAFQSPKFQQLLQNNPNAQLINQAYFAHLMEHLGFQYRKGMEEQLGMALPDPEQHYPPEVEAAISPALQQAAQQLLQKQQGEAAQQQAAQQAQDPLVQMQQQELKLKQQELADKKEIELRKIKKDYDLAALKGEQSLLLEAEKQQQVGVLKGIDMAMDLAAQQAPAPIPGAMPPAPGAAPGITPQPPAAPPMPPQGVNQ